MAARLRPPAPLRSAAPQIELPTWGRLDAGCSWREFAAGAGRPDVAAAVAAFRPTAILGVDWHSVAAYDALIEALARCSTSTSRGSSTSNSSGGSAAAAAALPYIFLNYRVYHRTASTDELALIAAQEAHALRKAAVSLVLSCSDAQYVLRNFPAATDPAAGAGPLHVLLPALRADMEALPSPADVAAQPPAAPAGGQEADCGKGGGVATVAVDCTAAAAAPGVHQLGEQQQQGQQAAQGQADPPPPQQAQQAGRRFLACCVRISPEKEPHRFVEAVEELQRGGSLERLGITPLMAGAGWTSEYGAALRQRLEAAVPQVCGGLAGAAPARAMCAAARLQL